MCLLRHYEDDGDFIPNQNYDKILESDWLLTGQIYNGNRAEWSPIWPVIIPVINKIRQPQSMIADRIG